MLGRRSDDTEIPQFAEILTPSHAVILPVAGKRASASAMREPRRDAAHEQHAERAPRAISGSGIPAPAALCTGPVARRADGCARIGVGRAASVQRCVCSGGAGWPAVAAGLRAAAEVAGASGREEQKCEPAEDQQRDRHRRGPGRVDRPGGIRPTPLVARMARVVRPACARAVLVPRPVRRGLAPARRPGVLLALPGERECAEDVLLRVRVVEDVDREGADRLLVAVAAGRPCRPGRRRTSRRRRLRRTTSSPPRRAPRRRGPPARARGRAQEERGVGSRRLARGLRREGGG